LKPPLFAYARPGSLPEALELLAQGGEDAKVLAGGQSLVPLLNFRLARPTVLIDLNALSELDYVRRDDGHLAVGALTRQRAVETSPAVAEGCPLLPQALHHVGHVQIRHRGTVGGSIAHADPAAELPAVAVATGATVVATGPGGTRELPAREFFDGPFMTVLSPSEILTEVRFPLIPGARTAFIEFARRSGDFALGGVAATVSFTEEGQVATAGLAACGMGPAPVRLQGSEEAITGQALDPPVLAQAARAASEQVSPFSDVHADETYRRELVGVLLRRALQEVAG
jgi:aerobic carbon-monoxide dehydrogenase medium subunit